MDRRLLAAAMVLGFLLDGLLGDPQYRWHPVRLIGGLISRCEGILYRGEKGDEKKLLFFGGVLVVIVCGVTAAVSWEILILGARISEGFSFLLMAVMSYLLLAVKSLRTESEKVYAALKEEDLPAARKVVSMIVGRDTERLDMAGVARAAVETVAENTSDGVVAPLFYLMIGGPVLGWVYKAVNTMDSMVGYQNDRYRYFGRAAAKLDDVLNFIPARISAVLMILAAFLTGMDGKNAIRIFRRDRFNHKSPNSAQTEAVCAGALRVQLAGDAWYFGVLHKKPSIGDDLRPVEAEDICRAGGLLAVTAGMAVLIAAAVELALWSGPLGG